MKRHRKMLGRICLSALVAGGVLTAMPAIPASAADPPPTPSLNDYYMRQANNLADLQARVKELDAQLPKLGVKNILDQAPRQGKAVNDAACNGKALDSVSSQRPEIDYSFCWDSADSADSGNYEWTPQGMTTVADAQDDKEWNGTKPFITSWYNCQHTAGEAPTDKCPNDPKKGSRISIVDPTTGKYAHILLAYPFKNDSGNATYMSLRTQQNAEGGSLHVGGMVWYGNYLYVADTARGLRVFDMRYIFDLKAAGDKGNITDKSQIGRQDGIFYGHGYRYVMPEVGAFTNNAPRPPEADRCENVGSPTTSFVSLDRSGTDHLITGEYCAGQTPPDGKAGGRVAAWELNGDTGEPKLNATCQSNLPGHPMIPCWHADAAWALPEGVGNIQGAVRYDGTWHFSQSRGKDGASVLLNAVEPPGGSPGVLRILAPPHYGGIGTEDLSYWPGSDAHRSGLWTLTEHWGKRMVYVTPKP